MTKNSHHKGALPATFPTAPIIVLVAPQMGENIGTTARAMLNCGFTQLRLVNPRDGWPNDRAIACCSGAHLVLDNVEIFDTVAEAIADCHYVFATTARMRDMNKPILTPTQMATHCHTELTNQKTAILFGCERTGLENDDVARADAILNIPLNPDFSSLNLAQAVLLVTYQWFSQIDLEQTDLDMPSRKKEERATKEQFTFLLSRLENELDKSGFFKTPELKPKVLSNIQTMLGNANLSAQEIQTFHGIIGALTKDN